jgi:hypothetical protein
MLVNDFNNSSRASRLSGLIAGFVTATAGPARIPTIAATLAFAWWFRATNMRARYLPDWAHSGPQPSVRAIRSMSSG